MTSGRLVGLAVGLCAVAGPVQAASQNPCAAAPPLPPDLVAEARAPHPFPTFCSIPPIPNDVRPAEGFKAAVDDIRDAETELAAQVGPETWSLSGTEDFAAAARSAAAPPPPMTTATDTEAFVRAMKKRATPPPRPR